VIFVAVALISSVLAASKIVLPSWLPEWLLPITAALAIALFTGLDIVRRQTSNMKHGGG